MQRLAEGLAFAGLIAGQFLAVLWVRHVPSTLHELEQSFGENTPQLDHRARLIAEGGS